MPSGSKKRKAAKKKKDSEGETSPDVAENQQRHASAHEQEAVAPKDESADVNKPADKKISESEVVDEPAQSEIPLHDGMTGSNGSDTSGTKVTEQLVVDGSGIDQGTCESSLEVNNQWNSGTDELPNDADAVMSLKLMIAELEGIKSGLTKILDIWKQGHK